MLTDTSTMKELQTVLADNGIIFSTVRCDMHGQWSVTLGSINEHDPKHGKGSTPVEAFNMALARRHPG